MLTLLGGLVGYVFQKHIRTRNFKWWSRLNYITAIGLDTGLAFSTLAIFFFFNLTNVEAPQWWGNVGAFNTSDFNYASIQKSPLPGTFGPATWH